MKVLQICGYFPPYALGGDATAAFNYKVALDKLSIKNDVIYWPIKKSNKMIDVNQPDLSKSNIQELNLSKYIYLFSRFFDNNYFVEKKIIRLIKKMGSEYDIIHFHSSQPWGSHIFKSIKKQFNSKIIVTLHDYIFICPKQTLINYKNEDCKKDQSLLDCTHCMIRSKKIPEIPTKKSSIKYVDAFISPSIFLKNQYINKNADFNKKIHLVRNAYSKPKIEKKRNNRKNFSEIKKVLFVGRLEKEKGILDLLKAFEKIPREIKLVIIGKGSLLDYIENYIKKVHDFGESIKILGLVSSEVLLENYAKCDIVCLPSNWKENNSMVLIEALSNGKPCITTNIGGNPEIIKEGKTGYIVPPNNPDEIGKKIQQVFSNFQNYKNMSKNCLDFFYENYSIKQLSNNLENLYKQIL